MTNGQMFDRMEAMCRDLVSRLSTDELAVAPDQQAFFQRLVNGIDSPIFLDAMRALWLKAALEESFRRAGKPVPVDGAR